MRSSSLRPAPYSGPRAVVMHFAAGVSDLAAATAAAALDGGVVVDLASAVSASVQLPAPGHMVITGTLRGAGLQGSGGALTPNVDVTGVAQMDIWDALAVDISGTVSVSVNLSPGDAISGHAFVVIVCR